LKRLQNEKQIIAFSLDRRLDKECNVHVQCCICVQMATSLPWVSAFNIPGGSDIGYFKDSPYWPNIGIGSFFKRSN
jgi:hypothetical protein